MPADDPIILNPPTRPKRAQADLLKRAIPFLRDAGAEFEDDGANEPLELAREIEAALEGYED